MADTVVIKSNLNLYPWQRQVINELQTSRRGYTHVIKAKRQCGKSILIEALLIQTAINYSKTTSICLSPTLEQSRKVFKEIKNVLKPTKVYAKHNDLQLSITLRNGSEILFKSAEQGDGLRGYTVTGIYCIDEAAYIPDDIFYETLSWVNVSQAPIVLCSTPNHKTGFFFKYYNLGLQNGTKVFSYNWSEFDTSALLPPEKLEEYRREVPAAKFRTEFLGEFLDNEGSVFGDYDRVICNTFDTDSNCYFGIDWGSGQGQDETAIAIFNSKRQMIGLYHFNDKDETQTINFIIQLMRQYKPLKCQIESNSIGAIFYGLLEKAVREAKLPVLLLKFTTTNESKERLINNFQVGVQNENLQILDNQALKVQMDMYEMKVSKTGKKTYNAATGYHDDCIIAMLLALDCISKGTYCIR